MRILAVCGSLQAHSSNLTLLFRAQELMPEGARLDLFDRIGELPHFNPDLESDEPLASVEMWRRAIAESDALLVASPEYGHSLPGALKNAIDWVIGSGELEGKIVALTASTPAAERGKRGLAALGITLGAVRARIVGGEPIVKGPGADESLRRLLDELVSVVRADPPLPER
jgi:NAD(P)H-dependent FMN reductase